MNEPSQTSKPKKKSLVSIRFLLIAVVLGVVGYFVAPWIMFQVIMMQDEAKAKTAIEESIKAYELRQKESAAEPVTAESVTAEPSTEGDGETQNEQGSTAVTEDESDSDN